MIGLTMGVATVLTMIALGTGAQARHSGPGKKPPE